MKLSQSVSNSPKINFDFVFVYILFINLYNLDGNPSFCRIYIRVLRFTLWKGVPVGPTYRLFILVQLSPVLLADKSDRGNHHYHWPSLYLEMLDIEQTYPYYAYKYILWLCKYYLPPPIFYKLIFFLSKNIISTSIAF